MVTFVNTPAGTRNPGFYFEVNASLANLGATPKRALQLGYVAAGLTATSVPELVVNPDYSRNTYGVGSMLSASMVRYRRQDPYGEVWSLPVPAPAGATFGTIVTTFSGSPLVAGFASIYYCGKRVQVPVAAGASPVSLARLCEAAVNGTPDTLVRSAAPGAGATATLTAVSPGPTDLDARNSYLGTVGGETLPPGLSVTHVVTQGIGVPDLGTALANVLDIKFDIISCPWTDTASLDAIKQWLSDAGGRWAPTRKLWGHGFAAMRANLSTASTFLATRNDQHMTILPVDNAPEPQWLIAADLCGSIANPVRNDSSLPLNNSIAMGWLAPPIANRFDFNERDVLLHDGGSTYEVANDGTVLVSRLVTTHQFNSYGIPDDSFLDAETPFQLAEVIDSFDRFFSSNFARKRLVQNGTRLGFDNADSVTPQIIEVFALTNYRALQALGKVQDEDTFKAQCHATIVGEGRVNLLLPITLANQLRIIASLVQFTKP